MAKVDVILLNYNYAAYISEAIESVLNQTYRNFDLVIADDGSTDASLQIAESYDDARCRVLSGKNLGLGGNLARALQSTTADLVAVTSADDRWFPNHLEVGITALDRHPEAGLSYSLLRQIDAQGRPISNTPSLRAPIFPSGWVDPLDLLPGQFIPTQTTIFRREAIGCVGGVDVSLHLLELDLILRVLSAYPIVYTGLYTGEYRLHEGSLSSDPSKMLEARLALYEKHLRGLTESTRRRFIAAAYLKTAYRELVSAPTAASTASARRHIVASLRTSPRAAATPLSLAMLLAALTGPAFPRLYHVLHRLLDRPAWKGWLQRLLGLAGASHYSFGARGGADTHSRNGDGNDSPFGTRSDSS